MSNLLRIGGATVNQTPIDWSNNVSNIITAIEEAKKHEVRILGFPELCITGYGCEDLFLSDWLSEKAWIQLQTIIPHCDSITACIGLPIRIENITYNGICVIHNQKILGISLKQNLAREGVHYEPRWFDAWPAEAVRQIQIQGQTIQVGDLIYEIDGIKIGFEICEDAWSKHKRPGYRLQKRGVDLIINQSASHFAMGKTDSREQEVVVDGSRLFECAYLFVNALGNEAGRMIYDGDIVFGQHGKILKCNERLSLKPFNLLTCDIDFKNPANSESAPITDGREKNEELARATSLALFDYLRKSKAKGFVISLSGGADSSMCAVLVAEMVKRASTQLGWKEFISKTGISPVSDVKQAVNELLTCAYQGTKNSSQTTLDAAQSLAKSVGAGFHSWKIDEAVNYYTDQIEKVLERPLMWETDDIALQNIQARSRSPIIWLLANLKRAVLITTSNRSEGDVGYATMDGDTSGSLAPLAGIDKPFIIQWLKWAEKDLGYSGLTIVNNLQPTAELRPPDKTQTDEKDLMPYSILVAIEKLAIRDRKSPIEVFKELSTRQDPSFADSTILKGYIRKFFRLWSANQWKRERFASSFHLDDLNVDPRSWCRFPILSGGFAEELTQLDNL